MIVFVVIGCGKIGVSHRSLCKSRSPDGTCRSASHLRIKKPSTDRPDTTSLSSIAPHLPTFEKHRYIHGRHNHKSYDLTAIIKMLARALTNTSRSGIRTLSSTVRPTIASPSSSRRLAPAAAKFNGRRQYHEKDKCSFLLQIFFELLMSNSISLSSSIYFPARLVLLPLILTSLRTPS